MKGNIRQGLVAAFILLVMVASGIPVLRTADDAEGQGVTPEVNVSVDPAILFVDVSPSGTGIAHATITVENNGIHQVSCVVEVEIEGYIRSPSAITVTLAPMTTRVLPMSIAAELRSPYQVEGGIVVATVKSVNFIPLDNYFITTAGFTVSTKPYARLLLDAEDPLLKVWPGKTEKLKFTVLNEGNVDDEVRLEVTNRDELYDAGFSIAMESSGSIIVPPKEITKMNIHITTPKKIWKDDYYTVDVRAISAFDTNLRFDYSVTVWVRGMYVPGFDPIPAAIAFFVMAAFLLRKKEHGTG